MATISETATGPRGLTVAWLTLAGVLAGSALALVFTGPQFAWHRELVDIPSMWLAVAMIATGVVFAVAVPLTQRTLQRVGQGRTAALAIMIIAGLAMRLVMIPSVPALEDDFYRYLWDGAVTASGFNPYTRAPADAAAAAAPAAIQALAVSGAAVLERVNHPEIKTIYPPVAQATFALAYMIEPWSLRAWRLLCLMGEVASLAMIIVLLRRMGRSPLWAALYWLNPLIVKELANSAHMEAIVMPFVLGALVLAAGRRPAAASAALGLAIGAKLWPVMLLPVVLRPMLAEPVKLAATLAMLGAMAVAWALPPYLGGLDHDSGFVAYATYWQTNSALFQWLQTGAREILGGANVTREVPGIWVRGLTAVVVLVAAIWLARRPAVTAHDVVWQAGLVTLLLFLLSPAQFPWYASWVLIFAPLLFIGGAPLAGMMGLTVFLPLYYLSFHLHANDLYESWNVWLVRVEWLPIWALFASDAVRAWRLPLTTRLAVG